MKKTIEKENYLKTIYKMEERAEHITVTGLSLNFNVSKSTVSNMVKKLVVMGLVDSKPYEPIHLTTKGSQKASEIISKDWDTYKIIGFDNIPNIKSNSIDKKGFSYLGVGEVVAGPTGGAISNAIYKALGHRIKVMPFTQENIKKELLN